MSRRSGRISSRHRRMKKAALIARDGPRCHWCGRDLDETEMTLDHIIPAGQGGPNANTNLVIACAPCNNAKSIEQNPANPRDPVLRTHNHVTDTPEMAGMCGYAVPTEAGGEPCGAPSVAVARHSRHGHKSRRVRLCFEHLQLVQSRKTSNLRIVTLLSRDASQTRGAE